MTVCRSFLIVALLFVSNSVIASEDEQVDRGWYSIEEVMPSAEQGDPAAQSYLGLLYKLGQGVLQNKTKAIEWYTKAAEQGDVNAQVSLGKILKNELKL